ncbi:conserved Plasmodium protein, unknown function [Plasmodium relictum]|uniref:Uncharacterized protein n=1 Tax=Plasmodium relictum TaxID=85471 RepID=A0A1J1HBJ3_PLARL|nr:conserved Plasmodium protein, unknown function [Plasmodium relictum]CRH00794.1 conserved Plasmodium protein, unknown function [Plasmodium relictum]
MCIHRIPGLHEKLHRFIFRRKISGPSPLYKTPLRHIWAIFFYIDIFILYIYVFSFFFSILIRHECFEIFPIIFLTAVNLVSSLFIDFLFLLIKDEEVVSEDEIILSTFFTILFCIIKIIINVYIFYYSLNNFGKIFDSRDNDIKVRCHTSITKGILLNFIVIIAFSFIETYIESILAFFSIVHFKSQVQKYEMII